MPFLRLKRKSDVSGPVKKNSDVVMGSSEAHETGPGAVKNNEKGTTHLTTTKQGV